MTRPIQDTDRVYSAISDDGETIRFSLRPVLDGAGADGPKFCARVVWDTHEDVDNWHVGGNSISCRSLDSDDHHFWNHNDEADDGWLDWLALGEPGRRS